MNGCKLTLVPDDDDRAIWLITEPAHPVLQQKDLVWLRDGFGLDDVREALLATGCVRQEGSELHLTSASNQLLGRTLSAVLDDLFSYFSAPGVPTDELLEVQSAVAEFAAAREIAADIPLVACAWLDMVVREDIADEARNTQDLWSRSKVAIDLDRSRERRLEELLARHAQTPRSAARLAGSVPTWKPNAARETKSG